MFVRKVSGSFENLVNRWHKHKNMKARVNDRLYAWIPFFEVIQSAMKRHLACFRIMLLL